jgi:hypothetical protein
MWIIAWTVPQATYRERFSPMALPGLYPGRWLMAAIREESGL